MYKRILIPLDGSALAEQALPHAVAHADCFRAELILLRVLDPLPRPPTAVPGAHQTAEDATVKFARQYLERLAVDGRERGIRVHIDTTVGRPHLQIIQYAEANQVDLIVMSTRGQSGLSRWLMGSIADRVVRGASVPVLMVRAVKEET